MPNYSRGKIYKLISNQTDDIYIGSTCKKYLSSRMANHRCDHKDYISDKRGYITSFELTKYDDCRIILIELCPCNTKEELLKCEAEHIKNTDCVNKLIPLRTKKEYYENNKEKLDQYHKNYVKEHKAEIAQKRAIKYKCECGTECVIGGKLRHERSKTHSDWIKNN